MASGNLKALIVRAEWEAKWGSVQRSPYFDFLRVVANKLDRTIPALEAPAVPAEVEWVLSSFHVLNSRRDFLVNPDAPKPLLISEMYSLSRTLNRNPRKFVGTMLAMDEAYIKAHPVLKRAVSNGQDAVSGTGSLFGSSAPYEGIEDEDFSEDEDGRGS